MPLSRKAAKDHGSGIPYYLPRAYLIVTENFAIDGASVVTTTTKAAAGKPANKQTSQKSRKAPTKSSTSISVKVSKSVFVPTPGKPIFFYKIVYLPDYQQKYALRYQGGTGTADIPITLKNGWMFTGTHLKTDSKTPETIASVGTAVGGVVTALIGKPNASPPGTFGIRNSTTQPSTQKKRIPYRIWVFRQQDDGSFTRVPGRLINEIYQPIQHSQKTQGQGH